METLLLAQLKINQTIDGNILKLEDIFLDQLHNLQKRGNALQRLLNNRFGSSRHPSIVPLYFLVILLTAATSFHTLRYLKLRIISNPNQEEVHADQQPTTPQVLFYQTKTST